MHNQYYIVMDNQCYVTLNELVNCLFLPILLRGHPTHSAYSIHPFSDCTLLVWPKLIYKGQPCDQTGATNVTELHGHGVKSVSAPAASLSGIDGHGESVSHSR